MEGHVLTHHHQKHELDSKQVGMMAQLKEALGPEVDEALRKHGECGGLTDMTLKRWLAARKWELGVATKDLKAHAAWRQKMMPEGRMNASEVEKSIADKKAFLPGFDRLGHPVLLVYVKRHLTHGYDTVLRYVCFNLDAACRLGSHNPSWDGKVTGVLLLSGVTMNNCELAALRAIFYALENHYPERLYRLYLYDAPIIFNGIWKMVVPFLDPVVREKISFVAPKNVEGGALAQEISPSFLPPRMGGTGEWRSTEEASDLIDAGKIDLFWAKTDGRNGTSDAAAAGSNGEGADAMTAA